MSEAALARARDEIESGLVDLLPQLRAFARSLCGDAVRADDLVQEAVIRAWDNLDKFEPGSNLKAWLFTILRNRFYSEQRKTRREVEDVDEQHAASLSAPPNQLDRAVLKQFADAVARLPATQREALVLTSAVGFSVEEAARICGCAPGTVKSRVSRARARVLAMLDIDEQTLTEGDALIQAAQTGGSLEQLL